MRRRDYLGALAALGALAGCTEETETIEAEDDAAGGGGDEDTPTATPDAATPTAEPTATPTDEPTATPTDSPTSTPAGEADISIEEHELVTDDSGYSVDKWVATTVTNEGDAPSGDVKLSARWYNEDGDFLDDDTERFYTLGPGETWLARVSHLGTGTEDVADYELEGEYETEAPRQPDGVELVEDEMAIAEDDVTVTGRAENGTGEEVGYLEAIAKLYDDQGRVLTSYRTNETDIPADETWRFDISFRSFDRVDAVADHAVVLDATL